MHGDNVRPGLIGLTATIVLCLVAAQTARAGGHETFKLFGMQKNRCSARPKGVCAAAAAINSFIYLENRYPAIYGDKLTPNVRGAVGAQTDQKDTNAFAKLYYADLGGGLDGYLQAKTMWIDARAPNTTVDVAQYVGSSSFNGMPTTSFLSTQISEEEDVEFFVKDVTVGADQSAHALTLTGINCTRAGVCTITYQDSNDPRTEQKQQLFSPAGQTVLQLDGLPGTNSKDTWQIYAAYAESPIPGRTPEPATWAMLIAGFFGVGGAVRRHNARSAVV